MGRPDPRFIYFFTYTKNQNLVFWNASFVKKTSEMNVSQRIDSPRYPVFYSTPNSRWDIFILENVFFAKKKHFVTHLGTGALRIPHIQECPLVRYEKQVGGYS